MFVAVPRVTPPTAWKDSSSRTASGIRRLRCTAMQSVGTIPKPTPGISITPAARASASRASSASYSGTSPARSR